MATQWNSNPLAEIETKSFTARRDISILHERERVSDIPPFDVNPKKIFSRCSTLAVDVVLKRNLFTTNGVVEGHLSIKCVKEGIKLGRILVYLVGMEENIKKKHVKPRIYLSRVWVIQENRMVPSDAVIAGQADEHGMWRAREGETQFDFAIPFGKTDVSHIRSEIESDVPLPSSYWNPHAGGVRYIIAGVVECKEGNFPRDPLASYKDLLVVESLPFALTNEFDGLNPMNSSLHNEKIEEIKGGMFGLTKKGKVALNASLRTLAIDGPAETGVWVAGSTSFVGIEIANYSSKKVIGLSVSLVQIVKTFRFEEDEFAPVSYAKKIMVEKKYLYKDSPRKSGLEIRKYRILSDAFSASNPNAFELPRTKIDYWNGIKPEEKQKMIVELDIPAFAKTVSYASLIDVSFNVVVTVLVKGGSPLLMELPIAIYHPASFLPRLPSLKLDSTVQSPPMANRYAITESERGASPTQYSEPEAPINTSATTLDAAMSPDESAIAVTSRHKIIDRRNSLRPAITGPSPASMKQYKTLDRTERVYERYDSRQLFPATNAAMRSYKNDFDLENTPTMDLDQELDKLNRVVPLE